MKLQSSICLSSLAMSLAVFGLTSRTAAGANKSNVNPTGTWKVTVTSTNTQARPTAQTLKLKLDGGNLTGTLSYRSSSKGKVRIGELPITDAKLQGNKISFNFTHPPAYSSGTKMPDATYSYEGTVSGETIKGTFTTELLGQTLTKGWEATRLKE